MKLRNRPSISSSRPSNGALLDLSSEEQAQLLTLMRRYNDALTFHFSAIDKENTHE